MRWSTVACLALAACQATPMAGEPIACGPAGQPLDSRCTLERRAGGLVLHQPDGSFRRMTLGDSGLTTFDGAEEVVLVRVAGGIEATIGGWTYRIPTAR